jgi:hypothetical protein
MSAYQMGQVGTKGSLWQNYMSAWFRVWNEFFRYPTTIREIGFFRLNIFIQREEVSRP